MAAPAPRSDPPPWQISIDTGGTFTDCLARDPSGRLGSAKVLTTSALRGRIERAIGPALLEISVKWSAPRDFIAGFHFRVLGAGSRELAGGIAPEGLVVKRFTPAEDAATPPGVPRTEGHRAPLNALLELAEPAPFPLPEGVPFEVTSPEEAPLLAARLATGTPAGVPLPPIAMRLATTLCTNALLERRGARVALFLTRGFGDLLRIGTQQRPDLFVLAVRKPEPLYEAVVEVAERTASDGSILEPLDTGAIGEEVTRLVGEGVRSAAVALLNATQNPAHERRLARFLRESGFADVACSSELAPFIGLLPRAETALVEAYLAPVLAGHLARLRIGLQPTLPAPGATPLAALHVMTSAGGLVGAESFHAKDGLLSGPAGGVVGAAAAGRRSGFARLIAFDMGGTSTDVARFDGQFDYLFEHEVGDAHLVAPALAIESVAAGGGSICAFAGGRLRVGPESAGARPGPACYGAGGPLTLTDVNLLLGRLDANRFEIPVSARFAEVEIEAVRGRLPSGPDERRDREALLAGLLQIANERMAGAIRKVSVARGYDPAEYVLVAFGGAGGQHACAVAECLGISTVLLPPEPGLLSARGIANAPFERFAERQLLEPLESLEARIPALFEELTEEAARRVTAEGVAASGVLITRRIVSLRFTGQNSALAVEYDPRVPLRQSFRARYAEVFGHDPEERAVEVESIRVVASSPAAPANARAGVTGMGDRRTAAPQSPPEPAVEHAVPKVGVPAPPDSLVRAHFSGAWEEAPAYERDRLTPGSTVAGPALVFERHSAVVVERGWTGTVDEVGALVLRGPGGRLASAARNDDRGAMRQPERRQSRATFPETARPGAPAGAQLDAVRLELFTNRLSAIAREMGEMLRRMAVSTNVKERLDFSCALLDRNASLVVNAPHIPVHLGALGLCVRRLREALPIEPGDVVVTNHPAFGGSHLPDITVVTPVHARSGRLLGYAANRAHHAEIGGVRPGSMPPFATTLAEEGVAIAPMHLVRAGRARWEEVRRLLEEAPYPSRATEENLADLRSAVAAAHRGAIALSAIADEHGEEVVAGSMEALQERAERSLRAALARLQPGRREALERLDDGSPLQVRIDLEEERLAIDFTGSAGVHPGNLNATPAIVRSVVTYVLRLLVDEPLPLNEGLLRAVALEIPPGILNPDFPEDAARAPAVGGGNVETSQRLVDALLKALGLAACSQGTMNNVLFGNEEFGYYETVCGGCGAGRGFDGASAVHSHMTNTRITDPEVLERRHPVRVERFAIRRGSGGAGRFHGGDGAVRELTFLAPLSLSIVSQHRVEAPYGLEGGGAGARGRQRVVRASGEVLELGPIDGCDVGPGDRLVLETPGGGGYGKATDGPTVGSSVRSEAR